MAGELMAQFERRRPGGPAISADLRLPLDRPGITALFGPSGCGKTTVLRCLAGLERPQTGAIRFGEERWFDAGRRREIAPQRRRIGYATQDDTLFPHLSVEENVAYGVRGVGRAECRRRTVATMELLGVGVWASRRPAALSGGQRQRVALARALAPSPRLLLLDEPMSALDVPARAELRGLLRRVLSGLGVPAILVTHDRSDVLAVADRVAVMIAGRMRHAGPVQQVFSRPLDAEIAAVVGVETVAEGRVMETNAGLARVRIGSADVLATNPHEIVGPVLVCIRAEEVMLRREARGRESARNQLAARITGVAPEGPMVRVGLDCGFALAALVTRGSCEELDLREGETVTALVKAPAVHLIAR
jgi:molybdate transport system ATP-binding protein